MVKRRVPGKKKPAKRAAINNIDLVRNALSKCTKADLVALVVGLARDDRQLQRLLEARLKIEDPAADLNVVTMQAIEDATGFDHGSLNYNFDYDDAAYETIKSNFKRLIAANQWEEVMNLSVELMHKGSYQVECSDEGLMTDDIQECLLPVIKAVRKAKLSVADKFRWTSLMLAADRVGFICQKEILELQESVTGQLGHGAPK